MTEDERLMADLTAAATAIKSMDDPNRAIPISGVSIVELHEFVQRQVADIKRLNAEIKRLTKPAITKTPRRRAPRKGTKS